METLGMLVYYGTTFAVVVWVIYLLVIKGRQL